VSDTTRPEPLPVGALYDGQRIIGLYDVDDQDDYMPYLYELDNGETVWIPVDEHELLGVAPWWDIEAPDWLNMGMMREVRATTRERRIQ
jgi:hypothetical protein